MNISVMDSHWREMCAFLANRLKDTEIVLAPDGLKPLFNTPTFEHIIFQNYLATTYLEAEDFDWAIIHKGMVSTVDEVFLDQLESNLFPVFANPVFVIFAKRYKWLSLWIKYSSDLRTYYATRSELKTSRQGSNPELADINKREKVLNKKFLRHADALLCSYPKCGRTWFRFMLGCYFHQLNHLEDSMSLSLMAQLVPAVATRDKVLKKDQLVAKQIQRQDDRIKTPLIVATHSAYSSHKKKLIFSSKDIIFLVRNIYDVLVSQYFERVHRKGDEDTDDIWGYICKRGLLEAYVSYLNGWAKNLALERHSKRCIVLTYESLKKNTEHELVRVLQLFNLEVIPDYVSRAVEMSSFENMQKLQLQAREQRGINDAQMHYAGLRTRRGKIGGYRDYLNESSVRSIHDYCQNHLNRSAQDLLVRNGIQL